MGSPPRKIALCTTVYPGMLPFLGDWYASVALQTDRDYDLWIALDGLEAALVAQKLGIAPGTATWIRAAAGETPAAIRQRVLAPIAEKYDGVVLVDSDDILHPDRVAAARLALGQADLAGCALRLVDRQGRDLGLILGLCQRDTPEEILPRHNIFGLSNTAWRSSLLRRCLPIPPEVVIVDWYLATRAWLLGASMAFDPVVRMDYRQHGSNMVRVCPPFDREQIIADTQRVRHHFRLVLGSPLEGTLPSRQAKLIQVAEDIDRFAARIVDSAENLTTYLATLNALNQAPLWWASVAHPALKHQWED